MNCSDCQDLLAPYVLGSLEPEESEQVHAHLQSGCSACHDELARLEQTLGLLPLSLTPVRPTGDVRRRLMDRIDRLSVGRPPGAIEPGRARTSPRWWLRMDLALAGGLAAAVAVAFLWIRVNRQQRELADLRQELVRHQARVDQLESSLEGDRNAIHLFASPAVQLVALQGSEQQPTAKARVFWDRDRDAFHLYASGLRPLPAGKTYELWFITGGQTKVPAGTFVADSGGEGSLTTRPPSGMGTLTALAVTDEPSGGSPQPTGQIQLIGKPG